MRSALAAGYVLAGLCAGAAAAVIPAAAWAQAPFDGTWSVTVVCQRSPDGALPYTWSFTAQVTGGELLGHYQAPGTVPSGTLSGRIGADGSALLQMRGLTGKPAYAIDSVHPGTPFAYTVSAHFTQGEGHGRRNEQRECSVGFTRL